LVRIDDLNRAPPPVIGRHHARNQIQQRHHPNHSAATALQNLPEPAIFRHASDFRKTNRYDSVFVKGCFYFFMTRDSSLAAKRFSTAAFPVFFTFRRSASSVRLGFLDRLSPTPQALKRARSFQTAIRDVCS